MEETQFIHRAFAEQNLPWRADSLSSLAGLLVPDGVLGLKRALLRADINQQWARWFVESVADPRRYAQDDKPSYAGVFRDVLMAVQHRFPHQPLDERRQLASAIARIVFNQAILLVGERRRLPIGRTDKLLLLDLSGAEPRCWICGARFAEQAVARFLGISGDEEDIESPRFIDIFRPSGLKRNDLRIEIDHVLAFARGGANGDNLRLCCGWCNRYKSDLISLYDTEGRPRAAGSNAIGIASLPQPFWTIRQLALAGRCEHPDGCVKTARDSQLTVAPIALGGAPNPSNLRVVCYDHDPLSEIRLQPPRTVQQIWDT